MLVQLIAAYAAYVFFERRWDAFCPPAHCLYFNPASLIGLLARHGLELLRRRLAFKPGIKLFLRKPRPT